MNWPNLTLVMITYQEWEEFRRTQSELLRQLKENAENKSSLVTVKYITAKEFMEIVRIKRTKFDQLVQTKKIKTIKKARKIYLPVSEADSFFNANPFNKRLAIPSCLLIISKTISLQQPFSSRLIIFLVNYTTFNLLNVFGPSFIIFISPLFCQISFILLPASSGVTFIYR